MKKYINLSFAYTIAALVAGAFYREFTKFIGFTGTTNLSRLHVHLLVLGTLFFLVLTALAAVSNVQKQKRFGLFLILYNVGVPLTVLMLALRGFVQTGTIAVSHAMDKAISGLAGVGHILLTIALVLFFLALGKSTFIDFDRLTTTKQ